MTWQVPSLGPPRVDFSWISSLADPVLERMQQQQDAANIMKAVDTNWQQPQVSAPGGLAALQPVPGAGAAQTPQTPSGASMGFATRSQRENPSAAEFYQTYYPIVAKATEGTGVDPMIAMGQIAQETGYGRSIRGNNLFNITGPGTVRGDNNAAGQRISQSFRNYETPDQAVADYVKLMTTAPRYRGLLAGSTDERLQALGRSGYAEDPGYGQHVGERVRELQRVAGMAPPAPSQIVQGASVNVPAFRSGLTPAQDAQNLASLQGMQQTGMQPAATGSVADRSIVPGSKPNPVAMDQNQAAGNGDLADLQSIVMNPRSPPNMREWAIGELAKRGIKVPAQNGQGAQAPAQPADPSLAAGQRPITPPPGYTPEQVAAAQAAAAQGPAQGQQRAQAQAANQPAAGASEVQGGYDVGGGRIIPVDQANNYARPQQPQPPQNIQPPAQQQPQLTPQSQPTPQQVVGSVPVQAVAKFNQQQRAVLAGLLSSPGTRQLGMALIQKQLDPGHFGFTTIGSTVYRHNDKTGAFDPFMQVPKDVKWGYTLVNGRLVAHNDVDPSMTRDSTPAGIPSGERVMTPDERAEANLRPGDIGFVKADGTKDIKLRPERAVETPDEYAQKKATDKLTTRFEKITEQGDTAAKNQQLISRLREAGGQIQGGTGGGAALRAWLADRGVKIGDDIGAVEAYGAAIDQMTPNQRPAGAGSTSNFEEALYKRSLPNLVKTPEGNQFILDTMDGLNQLDLKRSAIATQALTGELKPGEALKQMNELNKDMAAINRGVRQKYIEMQKPGAITEGAVPKASSAAPSAPAGVIQYDITGKRIK